MKNSGFNHVGLATRDVDGTIDFYCGTLGFTMVRYDEIGIEEGGSVRHIFMECGGNQILSFIGPENVPEFPEWDTNVSRGLGVPRGFYHLAFNAESDEELEAVRQRLDEKGIHHWSMDHDWARSVYFDDPVNGIALEYCTYARPFTEDDAIRQIRFNASIKVFTNDEDAKMKSEDSRQAIIRAKALEEQQQ